MRILRSVVVAGSLAGLASQSSAQAARPVVIVGSVVDPATNSPISGAMITATGGRDSAKSDGNGRFVLGGVPRGTSTITIRRAGYQRFILPDFQLASDTLHYDAELHTDPPVRLTKPNCPQPAAVVRLSADSVQVRIGPRPDQIPDTSKLESVDVLITRGTLARFGESNVGVVRVLTKAASQYPFKEYVDTFPRGSDLRRGACSPRR